MARKYIFSCRGREVLFNIIVWVRHCAEGDPVSPIHPSLSDNFSNEIVRDGMFGLGMAPKEILPRLFNPFNLKILDLHLQTGYGRHGYARKNPFTTEWIYGITRKHTLLTILFIFNTFGFIYYYYHIAIFISLHLIITIIFITSINIIIIFTVIVYYYHLLVLLLY